MKEIRLLALVFSLVIFPLFGIIIETPDLILVAQELNKTDRNSLVLFDVDYTLLLPKDAILRPCGRGLKGKFVREILENPVLVPVGKYTDGFLRSKAIYQAKAELVDEGVLPLIARLKREGIPTIALTLVEAGRLGMIPNMADWRLTEMRELGLEFDWSFPHAGYLEFDKEPGRSTTPAYKGGVLFSARHSKGSIFKAFLEKVKWKPTKIVFIDDNRSFLQSVEAVAMEWGIPFVGIHYRGAEQAACEIDEALAEFQFRYLARYGDWLGDAEARHKMEGPLSPSP